MNKISFTSLVVFFCLSFTGCYLFNLDPPLEPVFTHSDSLTYSEDIEVGISAETNCLIYYTLDETIPTSSSFSYSSPISITENTTLKAISIDLLGNVSSVATASYVFDKQVLASPTFSHSDNVVYYEGIEVEISAEEKCLIYYTLDETIPTSSSASYSSPISITENTTLKAICTDLEGNTSSVATASYVFDKQVLAIPTFSHSDEVTYYEGIEVEISAEENCLIYYTLDETIPTSSSASYSSPISITENTTLKAVSIDLEGNTSSVATASYTFDKDSAIPTIELDSGFYNTNQTLSLIADENTEVYYTYTTDETIPADPLQTSTQYDSAILLSADNDSTLVYTFKFKSYTTAEPASFSRGITESPVISRSYTIDKEAPAEPVFSHSDSVTYDEDFNVEITAEENSSIYYTLDETSPGSSSSLYNTPLSITEDVTVKAICIDRAGNTSPVASAEYIFDTSSPTSTSTVSDPYMNIAEGRIYFVSMSMEYSLDDAASWTDCECSIVDLTFSLGDKVWVRKKEDHSVIYYLGEVESLNGSDLFPLKTYVGVGRFSDQDMGSVGEEMTVKADIKNIGDQTVYQSGVSIEFYLSEDKNITSNDTLLNLDVGAGELYINIEAGNSRAYSFDFVVPDLTPGTYYIGFILNENGAMSELSYGNNTSLSQDVEEFHLQDSTPTSDGAFKLVNSWGTTSSRENVADGHYWLTYESAKSLNLAINYYYNDFSNEYKPTIIAVFNIDHLHRDECHITLGIGDPDNPYIEKDFMSRWSSTYYPGSDPFPDNNMVLDISEFAPYINYNDLYLRADATDSTDSGVLNNFSVEFYADYEDVPIKTINGNTGNITAGQNNDFTTQTTGTLTSIEQESIMPLSRGGINSVQFIEEKPDSAELEHDKAIIGVFEEGRDYNEIIDGLYGTGDIPLTDEQWEQMTKLQAIDNPVSYGDLPNSVDHSLSRFFPPIGNQGQEGSCTAFSFGYYIQTYTEAREHNWDLSDTSWGGDYPGYPLTNQDKIISPDFLYHQINAGEPGSVRAIAASFIIRVGGCSWAEMPYSDDDEDGEEPYSYPWPSESAFREAPMYRGREVSPAYWDYTPSGYFVLETDEDINLLRELIAAGYCVSTSINSTDLYALLDEVDLVSEYNDGPMSTTHANTIVGYKEGDAWDPSNPDN